MPRGVRLADRLRHLELGGCCAARRHGAPPAVLVAADARAHDPGIRALLARGCRVGRWRRIERWRRDAAPSAPLRRWITLARARAYLPPYLRGLPQAAGRSQTRRCAIEVTPKDGLSLIEPVHRRVGRARGLTHCERENQRSCRPGISSSPWPEVARAKQQIKIIAFAHGHRAVVR